MTTPPVPFVTNIGAPDVFANDATGFFSFEGCISITFEVGRVDHSTSPGPVNRVVVGRLVMPVSGAQRLALGLYDYLEKNGLGVPKPDPQKVQ